jgi:hypothetical protein
VTEISLHSFVSGHRGRLYYYHAALTFLLFRSSRTEGEVWERRLKNKFPERSGRWARIGTARRHWPLARPHSRSCREDPPRTPRLTLRVAATLTSIVACRLHLQRHGMCKKKTTNRSWAKLPTSHVNAILLPMKHYFLVKVELVDFGQETAPYCSSRPRAPRVGHFSMPHHTSPRESRG